MMINDDVLIPPPDVAEAINKLEDYLEKEGTMPVTNRPIHPSAQPGPTNAPIHGNGPEYDQLDRQLAVLYDQSVRDRPLMHPETRETRVRWLMDNSAAYKQLASRLSSLTKAGRTPVITKADEIRKAEAADAIQDRKS